MTKIRIIVISSVRPEPTSAGQIVLHRHLVDRPEIELEVYGFEPRRLTPRSVLRRMIGQLKKIGLGHWSNALWALWEGRWLDEHLPREVGQGPPTIVLTVGHGDAYQAARRFARKHSIPLVVWFQDWWPDCADVPNWIRGRLERQYRELYREADLAICVCEGMRAELGNHDNAIVLHDLAEEVDLSKIHQPSAKESCPFKVIYFGNLSEYGPMLEELIKASLKYQEINIEVRGSKPAWDPAFTTAMIDEGHLLPFIPRTELDEWLASADAFIVPMVFDPKMKRRMSTSFPSKMIEFAQFGKPLVVWGPEYCSAVQWARKTSGGLCVTDPDPGKLVSQILNLAGDFKDRQELVNGVKKVSETDFSSSYIRKTMIESLRNVTRS